MIGGDDSDISTSFEYFSQVVDKSVAENVDILNPIGMKFPAIRLDGYGFKYTTLAKISNVIYYTLGEYLTADDNDENSVAWMKYCNIHEDGVFAALWTSLYNVGFLRENLVYSNPGFQAGNDFVFEAKLKRVEVSDRMIYSIIPTSLWLFPSDDRYNITKGDEFENMSKMRYDNFVKSSVNNYFNKVSNEMPDNTFDPRFTTKSNDEIKNMYSKKTYMSPYSVIPIKITNNLDYNNNEFDKVIREDVPAFCARLYSNGTKVNYRQPDEQYRQTGEYYVPEEHYNEIMKNKLDDYVRFETIDGERYAVIPFEHSNKVLDNMYFGQILGSGMSISMKFKIIGLIMIVVFVVVFVVVIVVIVRKNGENKVKFHEIVVK